jgi:sugar phosphate isomerase/epimerase
MQMTRRQLLKSSHTTAIAIASGFSLCETLFDSIRTINAAESQPKLKPADWEIGCFNRPWGAGTYDEALAGMQAAGFRVTGLLGDHKGEPFTSAEATAEYLDRLKDRIAAHGLKLIVGWLRTRHDVAVDESIANARKQIDHAQRLGVKFMLTVGVDPPEQFEHFYKVMAATAAYAEQRQIQIVLKPHGGCSLAATEILRCLERVGHDNFRVWFDAGNIVHYSDQDPVVEASRLTRWVSGFCAKDCSGRKGDVMLQFGDGKVRFADVFTKLKAAEFAGPVMVECCGGKTLNEIASGARANREYLEKLFRTL